MIRGRDVIIIAGIDWNYLWQSSQEIARRLARAGNRVLYVENSGVRSPGVGDAGRIAARIARWLKGALAGGLPRAEEGVVLCSPLVLPPFGSAWRRWLNRRVLVPAIVKGIRKLGFRDPVLWTFLPTDTASELIRQARGPQSVVIYHCTAEFALLTPHAQDVQSSEKSLLESCDLVFATCPELQRHCLAFSPRVHRFWNGVDLEAFPGEQDPAAVDRERRPSIPIIGYVGGLHRFVDIGLLVSLVKSRPAWQWTFIGPRDAGADALAACPNVRMLGTLPHRELARHIRDFDVCIVPYVAGGPTRTVVPSKLNEYLAMGKPVVSTPVGPVVDFNLEHEVVTVAEGRPEPFLRALEAALSQGNHADLAARRRAVAALADWGLALERMSALIEEQLDGKKGDTDSSG